MTIAVVDRVIAILMIAFAVIFLARHAGRAFRALYASTNCEAACGCDAKDRVSS